jgi:hypothetical protein
MGLTGCFADAGYYLTPSRKVGTPASTTLSTGLSYKARGLHRKSFPLLLWEKAGDEVETILTDLISYTG